ncbi:MAG: hypothetical protein ACRDOP_01150 [Gaiellaceae bacterium]
MPKDGPITKSPNTRPNPLPPAKSYPEPKVPEDTPRWKPDYSEFTEKKK